ncbi:hypothetical protein GUITHDRAFT_115221 [Guillardia theta CCMP2712]|uniref:HTH CENPB-type domain-containing protein n=1 Tax=Guillardia theta (strain CCMP2712) TaxID=905079 RepID=L1IQY6_GUITC|nr:hypothetical protein GUITHDRAFT_115221 [Guillardia theta CCMP2712]EKX38673.1 hypothetical protein GUITHDRAFT_115221 [Guillardia theta CCMP2712]|eukprot:XP_005825653.1 hypothetical protein GUITHDRAFT_115221 [Guillardia theta CCMP2712]
MHFPVDQSETNERLTLAQKLDIIHSYEATDPSLHRTPKQLSVIYGKSRTAIDKILRPDNVARLKGLASAGMDTKRKRCSVKHNPELERLVHNYALSGEGRVRGRAEVCGFAEEAARQLQVKGFRACMSWYQHFMERHGLADREDRKHAASPRAEPCKATEGDGGDWSPAVGSERHGAEAGGWTEAEQGEQGEVDTGRHSPVGAGEFESVSMRFFELQVEYWQAGRMVGEKKVELPLYVDKKGTPPHGLETLTKMLGDHCGEGGYERGQGGGRGIALYEVSMRGTVRAIMTDEGLGRSLKRLQGEGYLRACL